MEIIKKIIGILLIVSAIAVAGVVILCGVLIVFPEVTIFGFSYLNTTKTETVLYPCQAIENMQTMSGENILIEVNTKGFDIEVITDNGSRVSDDAIGINFQNSMIGFTNSLDTEKISSYDAVYEDGKLKIDVSEPKGLFLKRDTVITIIIPKSFTDNNNVSMTTTTRGGDVTLGDNGSQLILSEVRCSCDSAKSSVSFGNVLVKNDFYIKNILGRITMEKEIQGTVHIDSVIGTYKFGKVGNLVVESSKTEGVINTPAITLDEVNNLTYNAESGKLVVNDYVLGQLRIESKTVVADIGTIVKAGGAYISVENATINIKQIGNFTNDPTSQYTSWDYSNELDPTNSDSIMEFVLGKSELSISKCYYKLNIKNANSGKVNILDTYRDVTIPNANNARINITFNKGEPLSNPDNDALIEYMNTKMNKYLDELLEENKYCINAIEAESTYFDIKNIRSRVNILSKKSSIYLDYLNVLGISNIETTEKKPVEIKAKYSDFVIHTQTNKNSRSDYKINFASINLNSFPTESTTRYRKAETDGELRDCWIKVASADESTCPNKINIKNPNGGIKVSASDL